MQNMASHQKSSSVQGFDQDKDLDRVILESLKEAK